MAYEKPQLSSWEKATLVTAILRTLSTGLYTSVVAPFRGSSGSAKYLDHVKLAMVRTLMDNTTTRHQQAITPSLDEAYAAYAKRQGFTPESLTLPDGTKAHWIGSKSAEKVVIWFHGGGYNLPPDAGHLPFASEIVSAAGPNLSVLMLSYTLAPHAVYPTQLRQAVELLRYTITDLERKPENVAIGGDSAGGNLAAGVLAHMLHPHPDLKPLDVGGKLGGAILLAPWASFATHWPSSKKNANKDLVTVYCSDKWSQAFLGGQKGDGYSEPLVAEEGWWNGLEDVVREILVCGGADELLADVIREFGKRLGAVHSKLILFIAEGEWHDKPTLQVMGAGGQQSDAIKSFVKSRL